MDRSVKCIEAVIAACVALTPERFRAVREEQWRSDLLNGPAMGISSSALLLGAACSSLASRFYELKHRGGMMLSRLSKGEDMKGLLGALGTAVALAGVVAVGIQANAATGQNDGSQLKSPMENRGVAGYDGWWNSTPLDGSPAGPQETVAVNTASGKIVDYYNRSKAAAGQQMSAADADYSVVPDPTWPANSVVIIDTATGKVIEDFPVDEKGWVIITDETGNSYTG